MIRRRGRVAAVLVAAALVLAGCAGLPTTGPVTPGMPADAEAGEPDFAFKPDSPQPGATPEEIVDGFIRAGTGPGSDGRWEVAREYLAPDTPWDPNAGVTVDRPGDRIFSEPAEGEVVLTLAPVANIDDIGAYSPAEELSADLPFQLALQSDGEWRITEAPDGLVLDTSQFSTVFRRASLMYFDSTWTFLVPDIRWFPAINAATYIADALVDKPPAPWLAASVRTAFPEAVTLRPSVPVEEGVAEVVLDAAALEVSPDILSRMQAQLTASLRTAGNVSTVEMWAGTTPLDVEPAATRSTRVNSLPLVRTDDSFGFLSGDQVDTIELTPAIMQVDAAAIQVSPDRDFAAVRTTGGAVVRVETDGDVLEFDQRAGLIDPTVDPSGYSWSVPRDAPGQLAAFAAGSEQIAIAGAWPEATQVAAMSLSRDGTRLAAIVVSGGRASVQISGVIRDGNGVPSALGEPSLVLATLPAQATSVAWVDDVTVGVLTGVGDESELVELLVGGPAITTDAPASSAQLAGSQGTWRVKDADGGLFSKRGATWPQTSAGILVLATQQGSPQ
ncbi:GerMN domain-containing protein [Microbacterium sp. SS28]|uniref:GerMN domain-containing protein n=1 Tax=Microbacterium sp. SS28 TaxID=2919948 RepID=UPI001FAA0D40|nr:LpqB family beta-propeller domain-containing protein [Microbacterium sp. SS28]